MSDEQDLVPATVNNMKNIAPGLGRLIAYSEFTGEEYSADPGDYWAADPDSPLLDAEGDVMHLARTYRVVQPAKLKG